MKISALALSDFRRFESFQMGCDPKVNCIVGPNGTGKTSILEAIWTLVATASFRTHKMAHLIQEKKKEAKIALNYEIDGVLQSLSFALKGSQKEIHHNSTKIAGLSGLIGLLLAVVISSEDLDLIEGEPSKRRYFLDLMLSQTDPLYLWHLKRYMKGLKTKNQLLKSHHLKPIPFFEEEMAKSAAYVSDKRFHLTSQLVLEAKPLLDSISLKNSDLLFEIPKFSKEEFQQKWEKERPAEVRMGYTLSGPHKEDLKFYLDHKEAKHFASMGEKKSLVISLKIAQYKIIRHISGIEPILLVDDYCSHLDLNRQENVFKLLKLEGQVFLTNPSPLPFIHEGQLITLK